LHTYLLSDGSVRRYGLDFIARLESLGDLIPKLWITLGISGDKIAADIIRHSPSSTAIPKKIIRSSFDRKSKTVLTIRDGDVFPTNIGSGPILIIDAAIHSGSSMRHVVDELFKNGAKNVLSYSLVVKKTSEFIPNYFGMLIEEHDRVFFQLDKFPNNRLRNKIPFGSLRTLREDDIHRIPNGIRTQHSNVYVYEVSGQIVA